MSRFGTTATPVVTTTPAGPLTLVYPGASAFNGALPIPADLVDAAGPQPDAANGVFVFTPTYSAEIIVPVGQGAAGSTFLVQVEQWSQVVNPATPGKTQWTGAHLWSGTATLCTKTGVAGGVLDATWRYCDGIATLADSTKSAQIIGGAVLNDSASVRIDVNAAQLVVVRATRAGQASPATAMGFLHKGINRG